MTGSVASVPQRSRRSPLLMLVRGLLKRCPNCGGGHLFDGWFTMKAHCPKCTMKFERDEGFFLGAFVVNFGLVLILLALFVIFGVMLTLPDPPVVQLSLAGMGGSVFVAVFFYPFSRTFWSAIDLIMKPLD